LYVLFFVDTIVSHNAFVAKLVESYFGPHVECNTYITLLQQSDPPAHHALLKAALVRRAVEDVHRVLRIREDKPALQNLLQKGAIGDDLYNSLLAAEKELEAEIVEVVGEANSFVEGWGQVIFPTANEVIVNERMRVAYERIPDLKADLGKEHFLSFPSSKFIANRNTI
jgi:translocation protein SEC66